MGPNAAAGRSVPESGMRPAALSALLLVLIAGDTFAGLVTRAGALAIARSGATTSLLPDGRLLVAGGHSAERRLEIFDPRTGRSTLTDDLTELPLLGHTATGLPDGRVLLAGGGYLTDGRPAFGNYGSRTSEAYDAPAEALLAAGRLTHLRMDHAATRLRDGRVLITGGENVNVGGFHLWRDVNNSAEIFDPATNTFRLIAPMHSQRANHAATLLPDGRVLIAGGQISSEVLKTMEIFDPRTETFTPAASLHLDHPNLTATLLSDGRVLIVGGSGGFENRAEIYDPTTNTTELADDLGPRGRHTATLLPNGQVLIAGGAEEAIVYDPAASAIVERFSFDRSGNSATLLPDGSVLLTGGGKDFVYTTEVVRYRPTPARPRRRAVGR